MTLIPYRSLFDMDRFFDEGLQFPEQFMRPSMDMYEKGNAIIAEMQVPGINADKIEVSVKDGVLHIAGISEERKEDKDRGYWRKEIRKGSFERMVRVPIPVQESKVTALCEDGILKIVMPKAGQKEPKKIKVSASAKKPQNISTKK